jgi:hypothetical protein
MTHTVLLVLLASGQISMRKVDGWQMTLPLEMPPF